MICRRRSAGLPEVEYHKSRFDAWRCGWGAALSCSAPNLGIYRSFVGGRWIGELVLGYIPFVWGQSNERVDIGIS